ncbi:MULTISPECIES: alpha/beta fold hydrolase [unclassified Janthinobacterium]|uniref:alpha/beta fold hydrolase n=1 Tax=unclassified Janthinobacterium TaxID=2610881 RepID=UPI00160DE1B8|nr:MULTISPECIES: alpha/beta hydrolase [unclassified Janthinobacterium]MBB5368520.1 pimeloyl-ACP methyl ester carboxylesterase [Janthinobacterium sp. K2C7]MBB5381944.1 pimeloyl-ACP methyl ester carboxylesterase [Janthinobacterium sp. K2Li3]MBB5386902.1 pimeloyl-ACP methyl ester carboxylesterase [Janthinobacterium sp. K2E3]
MTNNLPQDQMRLDLIPGTLCDERLWSPLASKLGDAYDCNCIPLQQAGTRQQMQELIASHSAPQSHLVGFSLGAYLAIEHAVAHPERIKSLTLIANSAKGLLPAEIEARERIVNMLKRNAYAGITRQRLRELLHPSHLQDKSITGLIEQMGLDLGKDVLLTQFATTIKRPDLMDRLPELHFPVLIVGAEEDQLVPAADLRAMAECLPNATLHMVRGASGHMIPLEQPDELAAAMRAHLQTFGAHPQFQR